MFNRVCTQCGQKVVGTECLRPNCKKYWQDRWENKVNQKIDDYQNEVNLLQKADTSTLKT